MLGPTFFHGVRLPDSSWIKSIQQSVKSTSMLLFLDLLSDRKLVKLSPSFRFCVHQIALASILLPFHSGSPPPSPAPISSSVQEAALSQSLHKHRSKNKCKGRESNRMWQIMSLARFILLFLILKIDYLSFSWVKCYICAGNSNKCVQYYYLFLNNRAKAVA